MNRFACIWIPQFELAIRFLEAADEAIIRPVILADIGALSARVIDACHQARAMGIFPQQKLHQARALCPQAIVIPPSAELRRIYELRILEKLYRISPTIGCDQKGSFFIALDGLRALYPDEQAIVSLLSEVINEFGFIGSITIADTAIAAWLICRAQRIERKTITNVIHEGDDVFHLEHFSIDVLPMSQRLMQFFHFLRIENLAQLSALPAGALMERFGAEGIHLEECLTLDPRHQIFQIEEPLQIESTEFMLDVPSADLELMIFIHKNALDRLIARLKHKKRHLALLEISWSFSDRDQPKLSHQIRPAQPTLNARLVLDLISLWLNTKPSTDPIEAIELHALEEAYPYVRQLSLFNQREESATLAWKNALSRLCAVLGEGQVVFATLENVYRPEKRIAWQSLFLNQEKFSLNQTVYEKKQRKEKLLLPVIELLEPPQKIRMIQKKLYWVETNKVQYWHWRYYTQRIEGEWWKQSYWRQYQLIALDDGGILWAYEDRQGHLLAQGFLD